MTAAKNSDDSSTPPSVWVQPDGSASQFALRAAALGGGAEALSAAAQQAAGASTVASSVDRARALRLRSTFELPLNPRQSLETLAEARSLEGSMLASEDRDDQLVRETLARCCALEHVDVDEVDAVLKAIGPLAEGGRTELLRQLLIQWLIVTGEFSRAAYWVGFTRYRASTDPTDGRARLADLLEEELFVIEGRRSPRAGSPEAGTGTGAEPVVWFRSLISSYWQSIDGDLLAIRRSQREIAALSQPPLPAFAGMPAALEAMVTALEGQHQISLSPPNHQLTLFNLGAVLVSAEAVAIAGSPGSASDWDAWFRETWPPYVLLTPAWPVLARRLQALLACRIGDREAGQRLMEEAIAIADRIGSRTEAAIARVQYAELLTLDPEPRTRKRRTEAIQRGREECRALGIPFEHHAHRARTAFALG